jgi:hypothetical protein
MCNLAHKKQRYEMVFPEDKKVFTLGEQMVSDFWK